jgi:hypothetical protein
MDERQNYQESNSCQKIAIPRQQKTKNADQYERGDHGCDWPDRPRLAITNSLREHPRSAGHRFFRAVHEWRGL